MPDASVRGRSIVARCLGRNPIGSPVWLAAESEERWPTLGAATRVGRGNRRMGPRSRALDGIGGYRERVPFTVILANTVAGLRPSARSAVLAWEVAILATSLGSLWSWHKAHARRGARLTAR